MTFESGGNGFIKGKKSVKKEEEIEKCTTKINGDTMTWLEQQKKIWTIRRKNRKKGGLKKRTYLDSRTRDMDFFLADSQANLKNQTWNIVAIKPTEAPGIFKCWIRVEGTILPITISITREVYMHSRDRMKEGKEVKKKLPRNKNGSHIYKYAFAEHKF